MKNLQITVISRLKTGNFALLRSWIERIALFYRFCCFWPYFDLKNYRSFPPFECCFETLPSSRTSLIIQPLYQQQWRWLHSIIIVLSSLSFSGTVCFQRRPSFFGRISRLFSPFLTRYFRVRSRIKWEKNLTRKIIIQAWKRGTMSMWVLFSSFSFFFGF